jgi:hypothetical protein
VKTGITIGGLEHIEYLPIMDYNNRSIPLEKVTSFDMNKAIQRSLTKAAARHGLGLYIYAGEDLPEEEKQTAPQNAKKLVTKTPDKKDDPKDLLPGGKTYKRIVEAYATGKLSKSGEDYRTVWIRTVNATNDLNLIATFDNDVLFYGHDKADNTNHV